MKLQKKVKSETDNVVKYIYSTDDNFIVEFSYINKNDGKDIICVPCQTMCNLGCKFCHTTDYIGKIKTRNLTSWEISDCVLKIYDDQKLEGYNRMLLVSYMGCGEPMENISEVVVSMVRLSLDCLSPVRFAVATGIPKRNIKDFIDFTHKVAFHKLDVKLHISLHYTENDVRKHWMPSAGRIEPTLDLASYFKSYTGNKVEIHYALIEGLNDSDEDIIRLTGMLQHRGFNVKILFYNEKDTLEVKPSDKYESFKTALDFYEIPTEYYIPPGLDIGASCGQFLMDYYVEFANKKQ
jgi:23S rRNA (adenine2503-C2)-methyltransferase